MSLLARPSAVGLTDTPLHPGDPFLVRKLLARGAIAAETWEAIPPADRAELLADTNAAAVADRLLGRRILTPFQAAHLKAGGGATDLVVGNYRLLEPVGTDGADVYRAEHRCLGTPAAVRVHFGPVARDRAAKFFHDVRAALPVRHPAVATLLDAGEESAAYFTATEPVVGTSLAERVGRTGPLAVSNACHLVQQLAAGLADLHRAGVVHRRLDPSAAYVAADGRVKLIDVGGCWLRPADRRFVAPEVSADAADVDGRADVFSLAALFRFVVGADAAALPPPLAALLARMASPLPADRPTMATVVRELLSPTDASRATPTAPASGGRRCSILLVDDEPLIRRVCRTALAQDGVTIDEADNGVDAVALMASRPYDVVLLDMDMPRMSGGDVLARLGRTRGTPHMKVLVLSGQGNADHLSATLAAGADDFIPKPFGLVHLRARVSAQLRLKDAQDRADLLATRLAESNGELEQALTARDGELIHARGALVLAMAKLVGARSSETGPHLIRLQKYARVLGVAAAGRPAFAGRVTADFLQLVEAAAPLHDIGKVAVPDSVLNKPGRLTDEERAVMQEHAAAGADTLAAVTARFAFASAFFHTAIDVARHHHERWDGTGYPHRLAGEAIPLSARIIAVGDVYDAMRSPRVYKPPMSHADTVAHMVAQGTGHFDPDLLEAFLSVADEFDAVFAETED